jgi:hypothetical protein
MIAFANLARDAAQAARVNSQSHRSAQATAI